MSFIGRAAIWTHVNGTGGAVNGNRPRRLPAIGERLTPLNIMTGSRIAATREGTAGWAAGHGWDESDEGQPSVSRLADHLLRPYQHLFRAISRRANRPPEARTCPRCGQAPHNDWGHEYERLVCMEITVA